MSATFDDGYALLVGVGKCLDTKWSLPVTVQDMQSLRRVLVDANLCAYPDNAQHIRFLHDKTATRQSILDSLGWLKDCAAANPNATAVVFYSGHGVLDLTTLQYHLIPHDYDAAKANGLLAAKLTEALRAIPARRLLVIIDSCHAEGMAVAKDQPAADQTPFAKVVPPKDVLTALRQGEGRAVFTSSRGSQRSWIRKDGKLSVYTYHLLEALQGAGNQTGDTLVRVSNLMNYLGRTVPASAQEMFQREQTPFFDYATEDFPVALLRGGKGLAAGGPAAASADVDKQMQSILNQIQVHAGERSIVALGDMSNNVNVTGDNKRVSVNRGPNRKPRQPRKP